MLPRHHRLTRPSEISAVVSRGRKRANRLVIVSANRVTNAIGAREARVAVIAGKNVGGAPQRNRVKRRIRHILVGLIRGGVLDSSTDCVVRALPASAEASWTELSSAVTDAVSYATNLSVSSATDGTVRRA